MKAVYYFGLVTLFSVSMLGNRRRIGAGVNFVSALLVDIVVESDDAPTSLYS